MSFTRSFLNFQHYDRIHRDRDCRTAADRGACCNEGEEMIWLTQIKQFSQATGEMIIMAGPRIEADSYIEAVIRAGEDIEVIGSLVAEINLNEFEVCLN